MPGHEERDHDGLRGQVRQLAKVVNNQVKRTTRLEEQFAEFQKESGAKGIISAINKVETAIRESKGDWTAEKEKIISDRIDQLEAQLRPRPDPVPA